MYEVHNGFTFISMYVRATARKQFFIEDSKYAPQRIIITSSESIHAY